MTLVLAYKDLGITRDITVLDGDGNAITVQANDMLRARIGHDGQTDKLSVTSGTPTAAGSSFTPNSPSAGVNRLRLDATDLAFNPGTYTLWIELFDNADAMEWKLVDKQVFVLEGASTSGILDISQVLLEMGLSDTVTEEERALVQAGIRKAEAAIIGFLGYDPVQRVRTEYYPKMDFDFQNTQGVWESDGRHAYYRRTSSAATDQLQVRHLPIRSVTELYLDYDGRFDTRDTSFNNGTLQTEGEGFWPQYDGVDDDGNQLCRDGIIRSFGRWPTTPGAVKITYTAGYSNDELTGNSALVNASAIWESALEEATRRAKKSLFVWAKQASSGHGGPKKSERLGDYSYTLDNSFGTSSILGGSTSSGQGIGTNLLSETMARLSEGGFVNYGHRLAN